MHLDYEYCIGGAWQRGAAEVHVLPGTRAKAESTLEACPPGLGLQVAYDPERIEQSWLADEQRQGQDPRKLAILIIFAALGVAWVWFSVAMLQR